MNQLTQHNTPSTRTMSLKQLNVKIPEQELRILEAFAEKTERTKTDIIREFIRSLQDKVWRYLYSRLIQSHLVAASAIEWIVSTELAID